MKARRKRLYSTLPCFDNSKACAYVDLNNLCENYRRLCSVSKNTRHICVIKADAYGHGAAECSKALFGVGCDFFAVSSIEEAIDVRRALATLGERGERADILILGYTPPSLARYLCEYNITQSGISFEYCRELNSYAECSDVRVKIHIALDTGMNRVGFCAQSDSDIDEAVKNICLVRSYKNLDVWGMFSHFARADYPMSDEDVDGSYTNTQFERFIRVRDGLEAKGEKIGFCHICNSAATLHFPKYHLDGVRLGIALYGYQPSEHFDFPLLPVMRLETLISHIHVLKAGERLGYGGDYIADTDRIIATLPIGYADGYIRAYKESYVDISTCVGTQRANLVGRICMDQCMVDITDVSCARVGDRVTMLGLHGDTLRLLAKKADSSEYEALCIISSRIPRIYK